MSDLFIRSVALFHEGKSLAEIGNEVGRSAAWVCRKLKAAGIQRTRERYNKFALTDEEAAFVLANKDQPYAWVGQQVGKTAHSISQWLQKRGFKKLPSPDERRLPKRACEHCGKEFKPKLSTQTLCSIACMGAVKKIDYGTVECPACKNVFTKTFHRQRFCNRECSQDGYQQQHIKVRLFEHNGVKMRSSWEVKFAQRLDEMGLEWEYEPTFFTFPNRKRYAPDFYVKAHDVYYEVKGWMKDEAAEKIRMFREFFPEQTLVVLTRPALQLYGIKL